MIVYYKRITTFCKYPWQSEIDEKFIEYSTSSKKWKSFLKTDVKLTMDERKIEVSKALKIEVKKVILKKS